MGITGTPGAGKSTLIEAFGMYLCAQGHRVGVLAVDPSSQRTGGAILGDKTRMESLTRHPSAFIRPSPSSGTLGGVAARTRESMLLCEAAGFDVIIVETVGVGQSETTVRDMVDVFVVLQIAGGGDELQGIKKGVIELADLIVVNKADGNNRQRAEATRVEFKRVLQFLRPATEGWASRALCCSAKEAEGMDRIWEALQAFHQTTTASGVFEARRQHQNVAWLKSMLTEALLADFYGHETVQAEWPCVKDQVATGELSPTQALGQLLHAYGRNQKN
jgi:LAO/AO transport system kinase